MRGMVTNRLARVGVVALAAVCGAASPAHAQAGAAVRAAAKDVAEALATSSARQGAEAAARELAQFGGEAAVRETLERVAQDAGEAGAQRLATLAKRFGVDALRAARAMPGPQSGAVLSAVDDLAKASPDLVTPALRALSREGEGQALGALTAKFGAPALEAAARHPGVGTSLVGRLGAEGADVARGMSTEQVISAVRHADDIALLAPAQRSGVLALLAKSPAKAAAFLDKHPRFFLIAGGGALLLANADALLDGAADVVVGPDGQPTLVHRGGLLERAVLGPAMRWLLPVAAALLAVWGGVRLFWAWRAGALRHATKAARAK